ncbi:hypothetical protein ACQCP0_19315 [Ralstonia pseudosolanacearum]|uniref:Uncharacterized protein n=1 Tax=Ralstonia solanacearum TaxID=305 RepID=A0A0S4UEG9_RALSL|nr:hypothetical protein [Ralstonia pseudosolanacearum]KAF3460809.1 hypothetical protein GO278_003100 [Ralstonia solanacearum]ASL72859.1 hypothetical protein BC350_03790 [Ralstonia pseudosolanacearum]AST87395.1 hypothetical protein CIG66_13680 [Ralstonia pseudosolanacearum]MCK4119262.1 hypothetical protein [Ralstonia pseudosolanacearum]MCK4129057.1 hypothetical protein [Ralstonia pseudosolanacearum]
MKPQKQTGPSRAHVSHDRSADADIGRAGRMPMQPGAERPMRAPAKDGHAITHAGQLPQNQQRLGQHQNSRKQP